MSNSEESAAPKGDATEAKCPVCGRPRETKFSPFCSRRCADVDLSRWVSGAYAIAGGNIDESTPEDG